MDRSESDSSLIASSLAVPDRFGEVFDRHYPEIHRYASRRLGPEQAEDVSAETFARAFKARGKFRSSSSSALPWLYGIAGNVMRMHRRSEVRRLRAYARTGIDPVEDFAGAATERASADASRRALLTALAALSHRDREIVLLTAWAELTSAEIGEALSMPDASVRTRLARARSRLAQVPELDPVGKELASQETR